MNDIFCIIHLKAVQAFISHLNSMEAAIQFTVEMEVEGKLPFFYMLIERKGPTFSFGVFMKTTHTGRYLHFDSMEPASHKRVVVSTTRTESLHKKRRLRTRKEDCVE